MQKMQLTDFCDTVCGDVFSVIMKLQKSIIRQQSVLQRKVKISGKTMETRILLSGKMRIRGLLNIEPVRPCYIKR